MASRTLKALKISHHGNLLLLPCKPITNNTSCKGSQILALLPLHQLH
jgi:hypothetical protein